MTRTSIVDGRTRDSATDETHGESSTRWRYGSKSTRKMFSPRMPSTRACTSPSDSRTLPRTRTCCTVSMRAWSTTSVSQNPARRRPRVPRSTLPRERSVRPTRRCSGRRPDRWKRRSAGAAMPAGRATARRLGAATHDAAFSSAQARSDDALARGADRPGAKRHDQIACARQPRDGARHVLEPLGDVQAPRPPAARRPASASSVTPGIGRLTGRVDVGQHARRRLRPAPDRSPPSDRASA